ncbi:MAG: restriction endonuclease subunit S [Verrucomicrobiota bacterium]
MNYPVYQKMGSTRWHQAGSIPVGWEARRLKFSVSLRNEKVEAEESGLDYMGLEHIESWTGKRIDDEAAASEGIATRFVENDVLFGKLRPYLAKVYLANHEGMATTEALVLTCTDALVPKFLKYFLISGKFIDAVSGTTYGAKMPRANWDAIGALPILLPSRDEQRKIAAFLDWKTGQIDALIARKKELLEKLKEKRLAVITRAVTKGLNPDVAMRNSEIPWLGEVPAHWEVKRFSYFSRVVRGASPRPAGDPTFFNGDFMPWITVGEITRDEELYLESTETMLTEEGASSSRTMTSGTLVITNSGATLGVPKILSITGCANDGVVAFEDLAHDAHKEFLYYFLRSQTEELRERMKQGGGQPNLNTDIIKSLSVPFPPFPEQSQIAEHLRRATTKADKMVEKVTEAINLLTEYRTSLITATTTGKIDVCKVRISKPSLSHVDSKKGF